MNTPVSDMLRIKGSAVETIRPTATILEAVKRMTERRIGCLAVVSSNGRLSGVISERDCLWKTLATEESPRKTQVKEKMTPIQKMSTVTPTHTVDDCMSLMTSGRHRHLLVLENNKLVGLISIGDVVKHILGDQQATIQSLQKYIEGSL